MVRLATIGLSGVMAVSAVSGWLYLWPFTRGAGFWVLAGWLVGMGALARYTFRRSSTRAFWGALTGVAMGFALMAVPQSHQGILTGLRLGYVAGALPVLWSAARVSGTSTRRWMTLKGEMPNGPSS
ncbi:MAG: hypothetical protein OWQ57_02120 [Sulfobacillus sp.]|nr:hypothetical protein [Sulfobacillus sp.]